MCTLPPLNSITLYKELKFTFVYETEALTGGTQRTPYVNISRLALISLKMN